MCETAEEKSTDYEYNFMFSRVGSRVLPSNRAKMISETIPTNRGFDGRRFLTEGEWATYLRRKPVRYIHKQKSAVCELCGGPATEENPLQNAHKIGFEMGIVYLALTPEFLDGGRNIVTAHRRKCNSEAELGLAESCRMLATLGVTALPRFLPGFVHDLWISMTVDDVS